MCVLQTGNDGMTKHVNLFNVLTYVNMVVEGLDCGKEMALKGNFIKK